jgi:hypothetical protein
MAEYNVMDTRRGLRYRPQFYETFRVQKYFKILYEISFLYVQQNVYRPQEFYVLEHKAV